MRQFHLKVFAIYFKDNFEMEFELYERCGEPVVCFDEDEAKSEVVRIKKSVEWMDHPHDFKYKENWITVHGELHTEDPR